MKSKGNIIKSLLVFLLFGAAIVLTVYPFIANYVFEHRTDSLVNSVEQAAEQVDTSEKDKMLADAEEYNKVISSGHVQLKDPFVDENSDSETGKYNSLLCLNEDGVMGYVEIPSINVKLPIYHGTSESVLEKGVGHLEGTSLPIGGKGTHAVITGHTGLSSAKLFTDLTEVKEGDIFFITTIGEKMAYKVDQIKVVTPTDISKLTVVDGKDYVTLVTCTPYGVNSHRLLVRGERTDYAEAVNDPETYETKKTESKWMFEYKRALIISLVCFVGCIILMLIIRKVKQRRR